MKITKEVLDVLGLHKMDKSEGGGFGGWIKHVGEIDFPSLHVPKNTKELIEFITEKAYDNGYKDAMEEFQNKLQILAGMKDL